MIDKLSDKLNLISHTFLEIQSKVSPGKMQLIEGYSPSLEKGDSVYEEEKSEMIIDTSMSNPLQELQKKEGKTVIIKLPEEEEKHLK